MKILISKLSILLLILTFSLTTYSCTKDPVGYEQTPEIPETPDDPDDPDKPDPIKEVEVPTTGTFSERMEKAKINGIEVVKSVSDAQNDRKDLFKNGRYEIIFNQPVDYSDKNAGHFTQRVLISIVDYTKPVVFVTQGYGFAGGWTFEDPTYTEELVDLLGCNQVIVEHRFFEGSTPTGLNFDWKYNTIVNQVNDLHRINLVLKEFFKNQKFISTGRSKGGQTSIFYETYFPKDIDIAVPYVAPICYKMNDMRNSEFLKVVGAESRRAKIKAMQQAAFTRRKNLIPYLNINNTSYSASKDVIFDLCVLEYSFMCWQYSPRRSIPTASELSDSELMHKILEKSPASYFSHSGMPSFFVNVVSNLGYYGYDETQFTNTKITKEQCDRWVEDCACPLDARNLTFDPKPANKVKEFLKNNTSEKMIFIYGGVDPWSSCAVDKSFFEGKSNMFRYDKAGGDHSTFIDSFDASTQNSIIDQIKAWLAE